MEKSDVTTPLPSNNLDIFISPEWGYNFDQNFHSYIGLGLENMH